MIMRREEDKDWSRRMMKMIIRMIITVAPSSISLRSSKLGRALVVIELFIELSLSFRSSSGYAS